MLTKNTTIPRTCQQCQKTFYTPLYRVLSGRGKFCGRRCYWAHKTTVRRPLTDRFWEKVEKTPGCWLWTGSCTEKGYGSIGSGGRDGSHLIASRVSWELYFGPIPAGLWVLHRCDDPACVRPDHLFLGTAADNTADMVSKGRHAHGQTSGPYTRPDRIARGERHGSRTKPESTPRGEHHPSAKLTDEQVLAIRARWTHGGIQQKQLAAEYGVSRGVVSEVLSGKSWRHLQHLTKTIK